MIAIKQKSSIKEYKEWRNKNKENDLKHTAERTKKYNEEWRLDFKLGDDQKIEHSLQKKRIKLFRDQTTDDK